MCHPNNYLGFYSWFNAYAFKSLQEAVVEIAVKCNSNEGIEDILHIGTDVQKSEYLTIVIIYDHYFTL